MRAQAGKLWLPALFTLAGAAAAADTGTGRSFAGPDRSRDGLSLSDFTVQVIYETPRVGNNARVEFKVTNVSGRVIQLGAKGVYLAVRWEHEKEAGGNERGFSKQKVALQPGQVVPAFVLVGLDKVGIWKFSPAYELEQGAAHEPWHPLEIQVAEPLRPERRLGYCSDADKLPDGIALLGFSVFGAAPLRVEDVVTIEYHLQNRTPQPLLFGPGGVYVAARVHEKERAFGHQLAGGTLAPDRPDKVLAVEATLRIDTTGEWSFRPVFDAGGHLSPTDWCQVSLPVAQ